MRDAIIGLIFLGTPHFGSDLAYPFARLAGILGPLLASSDLLLRSMTPEDAGLTELHQFFSKACEGEGDGLDLWRNSSRFYEEFSTRLLGIIPIGRVRQKASKENSATVDHCIVDRCNQLCLRWSANLSRCCSRERSFRLEQICLPGRQCLSRDMPGN